MMPEEKAELHSIFAGLRGEDENAALRARCQAAESALRLLSDELSYVLATPLTAGDLARARGVLAKAREALEPQKTCPQCGKRTRELIRDALNLCWGCPDCLTPTPPVESRDADQADGTPLCIKCFRELRVPQELDHIATPTGWVCIPCRVVQQAQAAGGKLGHTREGEHAPRRPR